MKQTIKAEIRSLLHRLGYDIVRRQPPPKVATPTALNGGSWWPPYPEDFSETNKEICDAVKAYTMTSPERVNALIDAVYYIVANKIDGAMVECGVWKGGSSMAIMVALQKRRDERDVYLYDTFTGMSAPSDADVSFRGEMAHEKFAKTKIADDASDWAMSSLDEVQRNVSSTGYPKDRIHFVQGKVEDTVPATVPDKIALLRLDTDWYESTKHELTYLFPLLQPAGVLIIDDYGHWKGSSKAVDEYIAENDLCLLLNRIDYSGRMAIKR